jgi:hypothetical protein
VLSAMTDLSTSCWTAAVCRSSVKASGMPRSMAAAKALAQAALAVDAETGEIVAHVLTDKDGGDITQVPALLATVEGRVASVIADGAYDGEAVYQEAAARKHDPPVEVVIPPRSSSVVTAKLTARPFGTVISS